VTLGFMFIGSCNCCINAIFAIVCKKTINRSSHLYSLISIMKVKNKNKVKKQDTMSQNSNNQNLSDFTQTHSHIHTPTQTHSVNVLPMIDVASASSEPSHDALRGGSGCRHHRPVDPERPLRSLSAGPLLSAVMGRSDRDATRR